MKAIKHFGLLIIILTISSCSAVKITNQWEAPIDGPDGELLRSKTVHAVAGTLKTFDEQVCETGIAEVYVKPNFFYSLINVVTLGIWQPIRIEYSCNEPCNESN